MGGHPVTAYLLDTHAVLWLVSTPDRITDTVRDALADQRNELLVSAASAWEISIKTRLGRIDGGPLLSAWDDTLTAMNATSLDIQSGDAITAGQLGWDHKDPFDRMLVAQALRRGLTIATDDEQISSRALTAVLALTGSSRRARRTGKRRTRE